MWRPGLRDGRMSDKIMQICKKCENEFKSELSWEYPLCKECSMKLYETAEHFWFTEILGYSEALSEFLPSCPKPLFHVSMKSYTLGDPRFDIADQKRDKKLIADMKAAGKTELEKLMKKKQAKTLSCEKCGKDYQSDGVWEYKICQHCAIQEIMEWGKYWMSKVPMSSQIPPIDVKKYCIEADD